MGLLCVSCWIKAQDAVKVAVDVITHLRSIDRAAQTDNAGVRSSGGWVLPIPNTWRTADDLLMLLGHPTPGFPADANVWEVEAITERYVDALTPDVWVANLAGAKDAVRFIATMRSALIQHPMEDYEHRVRNVRCPECKQRSLLWKPPLFFQGEVRVECTNPDCTFVVDQTGYAKLTSEQLLDVKTKIAEEKSRVSVARRAAALMAKRIATKAVADAKKLAEQQDDREDGRRLWDTLPNDKPVPLLIAPDLFGYGRSTIYRWIENGSLIPIEIDGVQHITPGAVKEAEALVIRGRPR